MCSNMEWILQAMRDDKRGGMRLADAIIKWGGADDWGVSKIYLNTLWDLLAVYGVDAFAKD